MWPVTVMYIPWNRLWPSGNSVFNRVHWFYHETDSLLWILMLGVFTLNCSQLRMKLYELAIVTSPCTKAVPFSAVLTYTVSLIELFPLLYRCSKTQQVIKGYGKVSVIPVELIFVNYYPVNSKRNFLHVVSKFLVHVTYVSVSVWWPPICTVNHTL